MRVSLALVTIALAVPAGAATAQSAWHVDAAPILDVSSNAKSAAVLFSRVTGATRLSDGTVVVADLDDNTLHFFSATGAPLRNVGRVGSGPGEFRRVTWIGRCGGDSLHVWDMLQLRMAVFAPNGAFVRQYAIPADSARGAGPFMTLACSSRGVIAYQSQPGMPKVLRPAKNPSSPTREERAVRTTAAVSVGNSVGMVTRKLGDHPSGSMYLIGGGGFPLPLASTTYVAVAGDRVFVGTADSTSTVAEYAPNGAMTMLKLNIPSRPTTADQRSRAAAAIASLAPGQMRQLAEDSLKVAPMPAMLPPYSALFGDADGVLWVQLTVPGDPNTRLRAVGGNGRTLGEITLRANAVVQEVGRDYVLAAYDDADDLPHIVVYQLHRGM